jgi:lipoate-protein ligase A
MVDANSPSRWRLLPVITANGPSNMALDHALLEEAVNEDFMPTLRFYRWSPPAISIGRFQSIEEIDIKRCEEEGIQVVRRPTGGKSILHLDDFTYSLVLPPSFSLPGDVVEAYALICGGIVNALSGIGLKAMVQHKRNRRGRHGTAACFSLTTQADLEYRGRKICGSAQVRRNGALLQHGSILLRNHSELQFQLLAFEDAGRRRAALEGYRSRCISLGETGIICSWSDLAECFKKGFASYFGAAIEEGVLTRRENSRWHSLIDLYSSLQWLFDARAER